MLRMGKNPASDEANHHPEGTYSPSQIEKAPPVDQPQGAFATQPGQKAQTETDPYRLVGSEITIYERPERVRLLRYVGAGGMGAVFYSVSPLSGPIAIKVLKPDIVHKFPEYVELFSREVAAVKQLNHPNIVKFVGSGRMAEGYPFIAVEWLEGKTLDQHLAIQLPMQRVLTLFEQIGSALVEAHKLKIIHLDLKPENIFVIPAKGGEVVKVIDFGISRVLSTYSGTTFTRFGGGSLQYCSPEQFGGKVSARSDIFSLGVMLYHMLAGVLPIGGTYIAAKQSRGPLPRLPPLSGGNKGINDDLEGVISKAIQFDPHDRYQSVDELLTSLRTALADDRKNADHDKGKSAKLTNSNTSTDQQSEQPMVGNMSAPGKSIQRIGKSRTSIQICPTCNTKNRVNRRLALRNLPVCGGCGERLFLASEEPQPRDPTSPNLNPTDSQSDLDTSLKVPLEEMLNHKKHVTRNQSQE